MHTTLLTAQPLVELERTTFLEQVDDRVRVRSEAIGTPAAAKARVGPMPSARSRSVVGHIAHGRAGGGECRDVGIVDMGGVHCGEPLRRALPRRPSTPVGVRPCAREAVLVLGRLLGHVGVQHRAGVGGPRGHRPDGVGVDGAHGVDGGTDPPGAPSEPSAVDALDPGADAAVTEPALRAARLGVPAVGETAVQVAACRAG